MVAVSVVEYVLRGFFRKGTITFRPSVIAVEEVKQTHFMQCYGWPFNVCYSTKGHLESKVLPYGREHFSIGMCWTLNHLLSFHLMYFWKVHKGHMEIVKEVSARQSGEMTSILLFCSGWFPICLNLANIVSYAVHTHPFPILSEGLDKRICAG